MSAEEIVKGLDQAKTLIAQNPASFSQVLRVILQTTESTHYLLVQQWTSTFLQEWFSPANRTISFFDKETEAGTILPTLISLSKVNDVTVYKNVVLTTTDIYDMIFDLVSKTSNEQFWYQLTDLKNFLLNNFKTSYPLKPKDPDSDLFRSNGSKLATLKLITKIIIVQTTNQASTSSDPRRRAGGGSGNGTPNNNSEISIANIGDNHSVLNRPNLDGEAVGLFDLLLNFLNDEDYLLPQVFIGIINNLVFLVQRRQRFSQKVFQLFSNFEVDTKFQYPSDKFLKFKLGRRFAERAIKNALNYLNRAGLINSNSPFSSKFQKIVLDINSKHDEQKKKGILTVLPFEKPNKKFSKYQPFPNNAMTIDDNSYSSLYQLIDSSNELIQFDVSQIPAQTLTTIALATLNQLDTEKLISALSIIAARYTDLTNKTKITSGSAEIQEEEESLKTDDNDNTLILTEAKSVEDEPEEDLESTYILPPPKSLRFEDKKQHLNLIIKKFFELSNNKEHLEESNSFKKVSDADEISSSIKISKIAINDWSKNSWLILLTRLATRGLKNEDDNEDSNNLSDLIRQSIFDYFLEDIHNRIDLVIEWLNEEWYSEFTKNSNDATPEESVETPVYLKWADKVLESMIPFLEATDRKITIRLLSDLPYLNESLVSKVTSLCIDPLRHSLGFQSLQFLILFRPPVKVACIDILRNIYREHEDLREETKKLLAKHDPEFKEVEEVIADSATEN